MPTLVTVRIPPSAHGSSSSDELPASLERYSHKNPQQEQEEATKTSKTPIAGVVGFRNSVREPTTTSRRRNNNNLHLSRDDIRASPRLQGYLFMLVASLVMLVSAVKFYIDRDDNRSVSVVRRLQEDEDNNTFTHTFGARVLTWKLDGAVIMSAVAAGISLFVLLVHFDSVCFPHIWKVVFRDGSRWELVLLMGLLLFWVAALHICTSAFSVGQVAPNVYFTTWIAFGSAAVNLGVWRRGADLPLLINLVQSKTLARETTYGWCTILVFSLVTAFSILELYTNRDELEILLEGVVQQVPQREWNKALGTSFTAVGVSLLNLIGAHYLSDKPLRLPLRLCCCRRRCVLNLDWRQVEGFLAISVVGLFSWFIYEYTGVNSALSGPSNPYFGSWGVWFSSILTFGTWMRENKRVAFILYENENSSENDDDDKTESEI